LVLCLIEQVLLWGLYVASTKCLLLRKDEQFSQLVMLQDMIVRYLIRRTCTNRNKAFHIIILYYLQIYTILLTFSAFQIMIYYQSCVTFFSYAWEDTAYSCVNHLTCNPNARNFFRLTLTSAPARIVMHCTYLLRLF
jgi:hypothetical protein